MLILLLSGDIYPQITTDHLRFSLTTDFPMIP
jgi:hypothetical protein